MKISRAFSWLRAPVEIPRYVSISLDLFGLTIVAILGLALAAWIVDKV